MIALLLALQGSLFPEPDRQVDFTPPPATMRSLAKQLEPTLGVRVNVTANLGNEVLAIYAKGVKRRELAEKIAFALDASWLRDERGLTLERTEDNVVAVQARERQALAKIIDFRKAELKKNLQKQGEFSEALAKAFVGRVKQAVSEYSSSDLVMQGPAGRFLARVVNDIPTTQLATLGVRERKVFRGNSTQRQVKFAVSKALLDGYRREQRLYSDTAKRELGQAGLTAIGNQGIDPGLDFESYGEPSEVVVFAERMETDFLSVTVGLVDGRFGEVQTRVSYDMPLRLDSVPDSGRPNFDVKYDTLSEEFREYRRRLRVSPAIPSPEMVAFARRPDERDPLELGLTETVKALAQADGRAVIIHAWDRLLFPALGMERRQTGGLEGFRRFLSMSMAQVDGDDRWTVIRHPFPVSIQGDQANRPALRTWLDKVVRSGSAGLNDTAEFLLRSRAGVPGIPLWWMAIVCPDARNVDQNRMDFIGDWLPLYGTLSQTQRQGLVAGNALTLAELSPEGQRLVHQLVYGYQSEGFFPTGVPPLAIQSDPTSLFPIELPNETRLSAVRTVTPVIMGLPKTPNPLGLGAVKRGLAGLGYQIVHGPQSGGPTENQLDSTQLRLAEQERWEFKLEFGHGIKHRGVIGATTLHPGDPMDATSLPEPWKSKVAEFAKYYREHPEAGPPAAHLDELPKGG